MKDAGVNCHDLPNARLIAAKTEDVLPKLEERATKVLLDPSFQSALRAFATSPVGDTP